MHTSLVRWGEDQSSIRNSLEPLSRSVQEEGSSEDLLVLWFQTNLS
jgi:hypothetical protein